MFDQHMQAGNGQRAVSLASSIGSVLNHRAEDTTFNGSRREEGVTKKEEAKQV